jgi:hypothetical protein
MRKYNNEFKIVLTADNTIAVSIKLTEYVLKLAEKVAERDPISVLFNEKFIIVDGSYKALFEFLRLIELDTETIAYL